MKKGFLLQSIIIISTMLSGSVFWTPGNTSQICISLSSKGTLPNDGRIFFFFALIIIGATSFVFLLIFLPYFVEEEKGKEELEGKQEVRCLLNRITNENEICKGYSNRSDPGESVGPRKKHKSIWVFGP